MSRDVPQLLLTTVVFLVALCAVFFLVKTVYQISLNHSEPISEDLPARAMSCIQQERHALAKWKLSMERAALQARQASFVEQLGLPREHDNDDVQASEHARYEEALNHLSDPVHTKVDCDFDPCVATIVFDDHQRSSKDVLLELGYPEGVAFGTGAVTEYGSAQLVFVVLSKDALDANEERWSRSVIRRAFERLGESGHEYQAILDEAAATAP